MTAANNILGIKTTRKIPRHLYNLDKKRYEKDWRTILKINKASTDKNKKNKKKYNA